MLKYWKWMFVLFVAILSSCKTTQQPVKQSLVLGENPKREFRGAWIIHFLQYYLQLILDDLKYCIPKADSCCGLTENSKIL